MQTSANEERNITIGSNIQIEPTKQLLAMPNEDKANSGKPRNQ